MFIRRENLPPPDKPHQPVFKTSLLVYTACGFVFLALVGWWFFDSLV